MVIDTILGIIMLSKGNFMKSKRKFETLYVLANSNITNMFPLWLRDCLVPILKNIVTVSFLMMSCDLVDDSLISSSMFGYCSVLFVIDHSYFQFF